MQMSDLKIKLSNFLSGDLSAETETMLSELGYAKKTATPDPVDVDAIKSEAATAGRKEGREAAMKDVAEILDLCTLAGSIDKAANLIQAGTTVETIRKQLVDAKASEQEGNEIRNTISPTMTGDHNPLIADALRRAGK